MNLPSILSGVMQPSLTRRLVSAQMGMLIVLWLSLLAYFIWDIAFIDKWYEREQTRARGDMVLSVMEGLRDRPTQLHDALEKIDKFQRNENRENDNHGITMTMNAWVDGKLVYISPGEPGPMVTRLQDQVETTTQYGQRIRTLTRQSATSPIRVTFVLPSDAHSVFVTFWSNGFLLMPLLLSMPLLLIPAWLSVRLALRPFRALADEVADKGPHDLQPLTFVAKHRELRPLVGSLNLLLQRVRESVVRERRFIADAAHELRTPLAAMRIHAEALRERSNNPNDASLLEGLLHGCDRATRLVSQLLSLMRSDANPTREQPEKLKLDELVQDQLASLSAIARQRNVELELDVPQSPVWIRGEREGLQSLVSNIVENAIKYSPHGGLVTTRVVSDGHQAEITVTDSGPGIPADIRQRVFERFFRAPDQSQQGTGLGLAIVKAVSDRHDATVTMEEPAGGVGLRLRVRFKAVIG